MLPHNKETLGVVLQYMGHPALIAVNDDLRQVVNKLTDMLIQSEEDRTTAGLQYTIRALTELVDRYSRPLSGPKTGL